MKPDNTLVALIKESKRCRSEAAADAVSDRITQHLQKVGSPAGDLSLQWDHDPLSRFRTALRALPRTYGGIAADHEFARAIADLADGRYETYTDREGHTIFEGRCRLGGIDVTIRHVVWSYDKPDAVEARLPALIQQYQR